jgi:hypothetical protein
MATYSVSQHMKTTRKPLFHMLGLAILDNYLLLSLWKENSRREVELALMRNMLACGGHQQCVQRP